jgi:hypothetical protein
VIGKIYGKAIASMLDGQLDWSDQTIKCALLNASYTPNQDTHQFLSDVSANDEGDTHVTVTGKTSNYNGATNTHTLDCDNITFLSVTSTTLRYAVLYRDTTNVNTSPLICYFDFEATQSITAQDVNINIPVNGLITFNVP